MERRHGQGKRHWFRSRFPGGYGWGLPLVWEGWVVYGLALLAIVAAFVLHAFESAAFFLHIGLVFAVLWVILWLKGEHPGRWDDFPRRGRGKRPPG